MCFVTAANSVTFAELADVTVITAGLKDKKYKKYENIVEVEDI